MFKIIVVGNSGVGKTSIVARFALDKYEQNYKATIAADFCQKILNVKGNELRLNIWDLVGMDTNFASTSKSFCRNCNGVIMVADITDGDTIDDTTKWRDMVLAESKDPEGVPILLVVNKYDLVLEREEEGALLEDYMTQEWLDEFAEEQGFIGAFRVSAKEDINITDSFSALTKQMIMKEIIQAEKCQNEDCEYD